jgi:hypothetical protein
MDWLIEKMFLYPRHALVLAAVVLVMVGSFAWWQFIWQDPHRVFDDMIASNLQTASVTKTITAGNATQSVDQIVRLQMGSTNAADWFVEATQNGASVTTESIGTSTTGYVRYLNIASNKQSAAKNHLNFKSVLNMWAHADGKSDANLTTLYAQSLFDITSAPTPPIGNLPESQRENILSFIQDQKVFVPDYGSVKSETIGGKGVYTYTVMVQLAPYVRMMQAFAHDLGMNNLNTLDPEQYVNLPPIAVTMSVDRMSHQLVKLAYGSSGYIQTYGDWGQITPITLPAHTITTTELQTRLQKLSGANS